MAWGRRPAPRHPRFDLAGGLAHLTGLSPFGASVAARNPDLTIQLIYTSWPIDRSRGLSGRLGFSAGR